MRIILNNGGVVSLRPGKLVVYGFPASRAVASFMGFSSSLAVMFGGDEPDWTWALSFALPALVLGVVDGASTFSYLSQRISKRLYDEPVSVAAMPGLQVPYTLSALAFEYMQIFMLISACRAMAIDSEHSLAKPMTDLYILSSIYFLIPAVFALLTAIFETCQDLHRNSEEQKAGDLPLPWYAPVLHPIVQRPACVAQFACIGSWAHSAQHMLQAVLLLVLLIRSVDFKHGANGLLLAPIIISSAYLVPTAFFNIVQTLWFDGINAVSNAALVRYKGKGVVGDASSVQIPMHISRENAQNIAAGILWTQPGLHALETMFTLLFAGLQWGKFFKWSATASAACFISLSALAFVVGYFGSLYSEVGESADEVANKRGNTDVPLAWKQCLWPEYRASDEADHISPTCYKRLLCCV